MLEDNIAVIRRIEEGLLQGFSDQELGMFFAETEKLRLSLNVDREAKPRMDVETP